MTTPAPCPRCGSRLPPEGGVCLSCGAGPAIAPVAANTGPLAVGQAFGPRYRILKPVGTGGTSAVYQAWDAEMNEAVALKVIRPDALADPHTALEVERRFTRELGLARQVTHRNVVRIHDMGEIGGVRYLTMPFIHGQDLADILKREGRLSIDRTLAVARQVASGLIAAHEAGIVHRDLKPENIMIDADGTAIITDFGISRSVSGTTTLTPLGAVLGTREYMAPEQAQGRAVDHRVDLYAFGLILYDLIGGRWRVSQHENPMAELMARLSQPLPPIKVVAPEATAALDAIITKCLQIDPADRYQTAAELLADLERLDTHGNPIPGVVVSAETPSRWTWPAVALAIIALAALGMAWC